MTQTLYKTFAIMILTGSLAIGWLWMDFKGFMNNRAAIPATGIDINVEEGASLASISRMLYQSGTLSSTFYPRLAGKLYPELTKLKQGEYHLDQGMSALDIFKKLTSGDVKVYQIRFIEGWTFKDFLAVISNEKKLKQQLKNFDNHQIVAKLKLPNSNPEGWFYPDTYNYHRGGSDLEILQVSHNKMKEIVLKYWNERDIGLPYEEPYQILIMASIIEKETGVAGERDKIAGVFVRRLNHNMRLQTDPTVIYGMGSSFDGDLRKKDLSNDSPYNTYQHKGLPPTPIAMPSEASISAAVHPAEGSELYFVAKGDGTHQFSTSLEEHNKAVRLFQLNKGKQ